MNEEKKSGFFTDEAGVPSSRRLNTFLLVLDTMLNTTGGIIAVIFIMIKGLAFSWPLTVAILGGGVITIAGALLFAFFTTWGDAANFAKAIKKGGAN